MKRVISLCIIATFIFAYSTVFSVHAKASVTSDKVDSFNNDVSLLYNLKITGISEEYSEAQNSYVSRGEAVAAVMRCIIQDCGNANITTGEGRESVSKAPYSDVNVGDWFAPNLDMAKGMGIIAQADTFRPLDNITVDEFIKVVVSAAGYSIVAEQKGGFPSGYVSTAYDMKLYKNTNNSNGYLTRADFATILVNLLKTSPMTDTSYGVNGTYEILSDETIMSRTFKVLNARGRIVTTSTTSVDSTTTCMDDVVVIESTTSYDSDTYYYGSLNINEFFGRVVDFWYKEGDLGLELVSIESAYNNDDIVEVSVNEIEEFSRAKRTIEYKKMQKVNLWDYETRTYKEVISKNCDVLINGVFSDDIGKAFDILENKTLNLDNIVLIDSDNNGDADLININAYYTILPSYIDRERKTIVDKYNSPTLVLDTEKDDDLEYTIYSGTTMIQIDFTTIDTDTVLSVYESIGEKKHYKIVTNKDSVTSLATSRTDDGEVAKIEISDSWYELSNSIRANLDKISLSEKYIFYFNHMNKIAGYKLNVSLSEYDSYGIKQENVAGGTTYGIVVKTMQSDGLEEEIFVKMYCVDGNMKTYQIAEKCKVDGERFDEKSYDTISSEIKSKLVKMKIDANGMIKEMEKPVNIADENTLSYCAGYAGGTKLKYKDGTKVFFGETSLIIGADTIVLKAPPSDYDGDIDRAYSIGSTSDFNNDKDYTVEGYYTSDENVTADIMIYYSNSAKTLALDAPYFIVEKSYMALNQDDCAAATISGMYNNSPTVLWSEQEEFVDSDGNPVEISSGDVIQVAVNAVGNCEFVRMVYDYDKPESYVEPAGYQSVGRVMKGCVYKADGTAIVVLKNTFEFDETKLGEKNMVEIHNVAKSRNYVFEKTRNGGTVIGNKTGYVGYNNDPVNYDRVVILTSYGNAGTVISYREDY